MLDVAAVQFFFDPMCPWAYRSSIWIREVRRQTELDISWRFFSLEEVNREDGAACPERRCVLADPPERCGCRDDGNDCTADVCIAGACMHVPMDTDVPTKTTSVTPIAPCSTPPGTE